VHNCKQICLQNVLQVCIDQIHQTMGQSSSCHFAMLLTNLHSYSKRCCSPDVMRPKCKCRVNQLNAEIDIYVVCTTISNITQKTLKRTISTSTRLNTWLCQEADDHDASRLSREVDVQKQCIQTAPSDLAASTDSSAESQTLELAMTASLSHLASKMHSLHD